MKIHKQNKIQPIITIGEVKVKKVIKTKIWNVSHSFTPIFSGTLFDHII
jgi:hypothetical protein